MPDRTAEAVWEGDLRQGRGRIRLPAGSYEGPYTYASRFESGPGTNPEELLAAAHAGCFSMALAGGLTKAGFPPRRIVSRAIVSADRVEGRFTVTGIRMETSADVPGIADDTFQTLAQEAKDTCPISRALAAVPVTLEAKLNTAG